MNKLHYGTYLHMTVDLKNLGIALGDPKLVEEYYSKLKGIFVHVFGDPTKGLVLDLNSLPTVPDLKGAVIRWLISVNLPRLRRGEEPVVDLQLVLSCPIWKVIKPPLRKLSLTREGAFKGATPSKQINRKRHAGSINS